jgi:hypothetical protein
MPQLNYIEREDNSNIVKAMNENFRWSFYIREISYPCSQKSFLKLSIGLKQTEGNFNLQ